jgi:hypothetical protein
MPHQKLIRVLNYVWLLVVFPVAVAILVCVLGHSANLGIKTFLLIECGMAVLSPPALGKAPSSPPKASTDSSMRRETTLKP